MAGTGPAMTIEEKSRDRAYHFDRGGFLAGLRRALGFAGATEPTIGFCGVRDVSNARRSAASARLGVPSGP